MQWQHGSWSFNNDGSLSLEPISIDGRQLLSKPCDYQNAIYTRYNQSELFKVSKTHTEDQVEYSILTSSPQQYQVLTDPYHGIPRLNLFEFDGTPMQPMYLVMSPPEMLPTTTLHKPTATATATGKSKAKRGLDAFPEVPLNWKSKFDVNQSGDMVQRINPDRLWWIGLTFTGLGGLLYFGPRRLGLRL